jgi:hypothetical protein
MRLPLASAAFALEASSRRVPRSARAGWDPVADYRRHPLRPPFAAAPAPETRRVSRQASAARRSERVGAARWSVPTSSRPTPQSRRRSRAARPTWRVAAAHRIEGAAAAGDEARVGSDAARGSRSIEKQRQIRFMLDIAPEMWRSAPAKSRECRISDTLGGLSHAPESGGRAAIGSELEASCGRVGRRQSCRIASQRPQAGAISEVPRTLFHRDRSGVSARVPT